MSLASELLAGDVSEVAVRVERADHQNVVAAETEAEHLSAAEHVREVHEVLVVRATFNLRVPAPGALQAIVGVLKCASLMLRL